MLRRRHTILYLGRSENQGRIFDSVQLTIVTSAVTLSVSVFL